MDWTILHALNNYFAGHDWVEDPVVAYVNATEVIFVAVLLLMFFGPWGQARGAARRSALAAGLGAAVSLGLGKIISDLVDRSRPFVTDPSGLHLFSHHSADAGFPSDHATASFAIAAAVLLRRPRWGIPLMVMAGVLSVGRVAMGLHYPSDVIAGALLGSAISLLLWYPSIRGLIDRCADLLGRIWDGVLAATARRLGFTGHS